MNINVTAKFKKLWQNIKSRCAEDHKFENYSNINRKMSLSSRWIMS